MRSVRNNFNILYGWLSNNKQCYTLADLEGGVTRVAPPPFQISKIKESNKTKQKIKDNPLEKEREKELHVCLVFMCARVDTCFNKHFSFKIFPPTPPPPPLKNFWIRAYYKTANPLNWWTLPRVVFCI